MVGEQAYQEAYPFHCHLVCWNLLDPLHLKFCEWVDGDFILNSFGLYMILEMCQIEQYGKSNLRYEKMSK